MNREPLVQGDLIEIEGNTVRIEQEAGRGVSSIVYTGEIVQKDASLPVKVIIKEFYPRKGLKRVGTKLQRLAMDELPAEFWSVAELFKVGYRKQNEMGNSNLMEIAVRPYLYGSYGDSEYYVSDVHLGMSLEHAQFSTLKEKLDCMIRLAEVFGILHNDDSDQNERKFVMLDFAPSNILWIENPKGVRILDADSIVPYKGAKAGQAYSLRTVGIGDNNYTSPGLRKLKRNVDSGLVTLEQELPFYARPQENVYSLGCYFYELLFGSFSPEDLCEMNYGELCGKLFEKYEAELGSLSNAEALLDVVWKAVQPKFRNRQKNGRVLMQELNAVLKKIHAYEYIPKKTIAQANGTFLAYNLLEEYPLFEYLSEKENGKKQLHAAIIGNHRLREEMLSAILCMQMLDTEMIIDIMAEDAEEFWKEYLTANPAAASAVTWSVNGEIQSDRIDPALITERLAHMNLISKKAEDPLTAEDLDGARYIVLLEETVHDRQERMNRILQNLKRRQETENVLISYLQHVQEISEEAVTCEQDAILLHRINSSKFTEEYNEEMFSRRVFRMALYAHAYYNGYMSGNEAVDLTALEKELQENPYHMGSSQRTGLHSIYKLASVGIHRNALGKFLQYYRLLQDKNILEQLTWLEHRSWTAFLITKGAVPLSYEEFLQTAYQNGNNWKDVTTDPKHMRHPLLVSSGVNTEYMLPVEDGLENLESRINLENMDLLDQMSYQIARWYWENRSAFCTKLDENIRQLHRLLKKKPDDICIANLSEMITELEHAGMEAIAHIGERMSKQDRTYSKNWNERLLRIKTYCSKHEQYEILQKLEQLDQDMKPVKDSYSERDMKQLDRDLVFAVMDLLGI